MRSARTWAVWAVIVAGSVAGLSCGDGVGSGSGGPSARQREARSDLLRDLVASKQAAPNPQELQAQGERLRRGEDAPPDEGARPADAPARLSGTVQRVEDGALRVRDGQGAERAVRVDGTTRYVKDGEVVARGELRDGAEVRVFYDVKQGAPVAREVEVLDGAGPRE